MAASEVDLPEPVPPTRITRPRLLSDTSFNTGGSGERLGVRRRQLLCRDRCQLAVDFHRWREIIRDEKIRGLLAQHGLEETVQVALRLLVVPVSNSSSS